MTRMDPPSKSQCRGAPSSSVSETRSSGARLLFATKAAAVLFSALLMCCSALALLGRPMWTSGSFLGRVLLLSRASVAADAVDLGWYPPAKTQINNLTAVVNGNGVYGFIYNSSETPADVYGTYNWCNMPHVRAAEYVKPDDKYQLIYVELIHRHHKRTPYQDNSFPIETYHWDCGDIIQYHHASPLSRNNTQTATPAYWKTSPSPLNPFTPSGWQGTCSFPQITASGLSDSWQHGADLYTVYHTIHALLPAQNNPSWRSKTAYHVTNNPITSQVAGMLLHGSWRTTDPVPLLIQPPQTDSLEPRYPCPGASRLLSKIQSSSGWKAHLQTAVPLFADLDARSGVSPDDAAFHASVDHYYDNLSARQCHAKPLPCHPDASATNTAAEGECITQSLADMTYRFGQWEYDFFYRSAGPESLAFALASYGVWVAQLAANLRAVVEGKGGEVVYRHHVAHDGSVSRLLGVLQADEMVWPGMGGEVVFELYVKREGGYFVRVLFGGRVLKSSNPSLGLMDLMPVEVLLAYFDGLVGVDAGLVVGKCK